MTTPTWREIDEFCRKDGWELVRSTDHAFFRKTLVGGTILETHRSFADDKTMSPGRFLAILRNQLRVSPDAVWDTHRTGRPAPRPGTSPPAEPSLPVWMVRILLDDLGLPQEEIARISEDDARRRIEEYWARPWRAEETELIALSAHLRDSPL